MTWVVVYAATGLAREMHQTRWRQGESSCYWLEHRGGEVPIAGAIIGALAQIEVIAEDRKLSRLGCTIKVGFLLKVPRIRQRLSARAGGVHSGCPSVGDWKKMIRRSERNIAKGRQRMPRLRCLDSRCTLGGFRNGSPPVISAGSSTR